MSFPHTVSAQLHIQWIPGAVPGMKQLGSEDDYSHLSCADVMSAWDCTTYLTYFLDVMFNSPPLVCPPYRGEGV